ncbi:hypothetical protein [Streptomyces venezuelae]|nr:hypothetical protein [Streptomyces venezuelae]
MSTDPAQDALRQQEDAFYAAKDADRQGLSATAGAYQTLADDAFDDFLDITQEEHNRRKGK